MSGIGPIDQALLPADVRTGSTQQREAYTAALGFERQLVEQLAKQLGATTGADDSKDSAATKSYRDLMPGALADAVTAAGGLGLAAQISKDIAAA
jgi:Rod binding domain-containing protein